MTRRVNKFLIAIALLVCAIPVLLSASDQVGQVTFNNLPLPGATVTATQGDKKVTTHADMDGRYRLPDLADGVWQMRVEMLGFEAATQDVTIAEKAEPTIWQMKLQSFADITRGREIQQSAGAGVIPSAPPAAAAPGTSGIVPSRATNPAPGANNNGNNNRPQGQAPPADLPDSNLANDGLLINGSVNNGAASPFAQAAAFGNNRRGPRSLYTGNMGAVLGNSAFDARPYSFTGTPAAKPDYNDLQLLGTIGGPLRIPHLLRRNGPNFFAGYQHNNDHNAITQSTLVPTPLERTGDFSQSRDAFGRPLVVIDPVTGLPFDGNAIPKERLSPQALSLLQYYPSPNIEPGGRFNYEIPIITATQQDNGQFRATQTVNARNNLQGTFAYSRTSVETNNVFNEPDTTVASAFDTSITWNRRFSQVTQMRTRYQLTHTSTDTSPYFSNRTNVSGNAGITGNDQTPPNWGPPSLLFSSGIAGFGSTQFANNTTITNLATLEVLRTRGRHSLTIGGNVRWQHVNILSQQDARGMFGFSGVATGSDFADFMLGLPNTSTIAFGNADKFLRSSGGDLYFNDDFRISPSLTLNAGVRWEFDTPFAETGNRLSNLDVAPDFSEVSQVQPDGVGSITGQTFPSALISADPHLIQPRLGLAWRPIPGSSLVVRAGYGVYRNTNTYQSIALLMAQQPPFSKALSLQSTRDELLTLANGFVGTPATALNTFAVDPDFHVSYAQNWQVSAQRDVPGSMTIIATYLGSSGSNLFQEFLPNTYAPGGINPCPACPSGFTYLTSNGSSLRNAGQIEIRRRLRAGFTSTLRYTFAKATDNAAAFSGAALSGASIAQDWTNLDAERAPSNFDQRHLMTAQVQYTTGIGAAGGAMLTGWQGALVKNWTISAQLNTGTGLPTTPVYVTPVANTGVTGTVRASATRVDEDRIPDGYYLNPLAFTAPAGGSWGDAGRNSVTGPPQFTLNGGVTRTFLFGNRYNLDWRLDATNLLNVVTYSNINTLVGSSQFGLPNRANTMRKLQMTFRLRF